jgi:hypothetical protein
MNVWGKFDIKISKLLLFSENYYGRKHAHSNCNEKCVNKNGSNLKQCFKVVKLRDF